MNRFLAAAAAALALLSSPFAQANQPSAPAVSSAAWQSPYVSAMGAAIRSRLFYPSAARARRARGVVGVAFTIGASGALTSFAITRSSGDKDLDAGARTQVQSIHFPPPPADWVGRVIVTNLSFEP
jgi:periplasmic protein TonB